MAAASTNTVSEIGRRGFAPVASVRSRAMVAGQIEGRISMAKIATLRRGTNLVPPKSLVPITEQDAAKAFSAVILKFSAGELAQTSKRSKEAAKAWKEGRSLPSSWSLLNMAQDIPAVRNWVLGMLGAGAETEAPPPEVLNALLGGLHAVASIPGPDGAAARAVLKKMGK